MRIEPIELKKINPSQKKAGRVSVYTKDIKKLNTEAICGAFIKTRK